MLGMITLGLSKLSGNADYNILDQKIIDGTSHITNFTSKLKKSSIRNNSKLFIRWVYVSCNYILINTTI